MQERHRIKVSNFDAVQQAVLWRQLGASKAIPLLNAYLRSAILFGEELALDRNELLDGIYFLTLGPEGIAEVLGVRPHERLPLTILAQPAIAAHPEDLTLIPPYGWDGAETNRVSFAHQITNCEEDEFVKASSAWAALRHKPDARDGSSNDDFIPDPGPDWYPGTGLTDRYHPMVSEEEIARELRTRREIWQDAAVHDRVGMAAWNVKTPVDVFLEEALQLQRDILEDTTAGEVEKARGTEAVLGISKPQRKVAIQEIREIGRQMNPPIDKRERMLLVEMWCRAYVQALAWKDNCLLLTFTYVPEGVSEEGSVQERRQYGLAAKPATLWERFVVTRRSRRDGERLPIRVEGSIPEHLEKLSTASFRELAESNTGVISEMLRSSNSRAMVDLAFTVKNAADRGEEVRNRKRGSFIRGVLISGAVFLATLLTALGDQIDASRWEKGVVVAIVTILTIASSLPWDNILDIFSFRPAAAQSTLNLVTTGPRGGSSTLKER